MKKARVSVVRASNYRCDELQPALRRALSLIGGLENILKPKAKVFVKINLLSPESPAERGICTHPAFTAEVLRLLKEFGLEITVGDDIHSKGKDGFLISGYRQLSKELGVRLVNLKEVGFKEVNTNGEVLKKVYISPLVLESDFVINLPKLKTHSFTVLTGAVKNMFGVIPHGLRLDYHRRFVSSDIFCQMLVDLFSCARPHLTIIDAIDAMEGEGPSAGNKKRIGVILASRDAVAVDAVASRIVGFDPLDIMTTFHAHRRGLGTGAVDEIEVIGERISDVEVKGFKHSAVAVGFLRTKIPAFLYAYIQSQLVLTPEVAREKCEACLECINICPSKAATLERGSVNIDNNLCIHCMCCHEVCRFQAIRLKQKPLGRAVRGLIFVHNKLRRLDG
jgi:uncharacterized protein (DUF362 family)/Pyruvate/2-oxoacid:ferredoxin oxidoreductase delta subunit